MALSVVSFSFVLGLLFEEILLKVVSTDTIRFKGSNYFLLVNYLPIVKM